ncbi:hypothetical protein KHM19_28400 [Leptospira borgpetersenii]|uniref:Uncharacterized protein n=1 Tax=Leptospira borgpetersenii serovar Javanica str. UI 09931 TaxID=1049767 RepID=A0AAV3JAR1_LEPBO|nr:hypothetical protein C4Q31_06465 [Leptospira borgpetersenii serovar Ceylonica]EKQ93527.1 hypothetical protein LEP1GSC101_0270 [Leptospira borgpetersenii str. UI 09149]EMN56508.1 hypothetical protein LEP1GSC090_3561 [Leptospira borgpetersenii serovar Javanica str. MK146]EPG57015.1 hypothetical protein LEP1GSC103_1555 [Leptospira borgpetersenii serovar Javanica str. UI 09931]GIM20346.1 hypothetical protein KHM09_27970 [Leptospira borgpetersenii]
MSITETVPKIALKDMVFRKNEELLTIFHTILEEVKKPINHEKTCRAGTTGKMDKCTNFFRCQNFITNLRNNYKKLPFRFSDRLINLSQIAIREFKLKKKSE